MQSTRHKWVFLLASCFTHLVLSCEKAGLENACDPTSTEFRDTLIAKTMLGDTSPTCAAVGTSATGAAGPKLIFVSNTSSQGNLGGISGADSICNSDSAKPANTGAYKALIVNAAIRVASITADVGDGQVDWVLLPNQLYTRPDGTVLMTTNSASIYLFGPNLANAIGTTGAAIWTGLNADWTTAGGCVGWTDPTGGPFGRYGTANSASAAAINGGSLACSNSVNLYCVQQ